VLLIRRRRYESTGERERLRDDETDRWRRAMGERDRDRPRCVTGVKDGSRRPSSATDPRRRGGGERDRERDREDEMERWRRATGERERERPR
jgi:hypothetical protein